MHPLKKLSKLFGEKKTNQGKVIRTSGQNLIIATPKGSLSVQKNTNDVTSYTEGDTVLLANGVVIGKRLKQPKVYVV